MNNKRQTETDDSSFFRPQLPTNSSGDESELEEEHSSFANNSAGTSPKKRRNKGRTPSVDSCENVDLPLDVDGRVAVDKVFHPEFDWKTPLVQSIQASYHVPGKFEDAAEKFTLDLNTLELTQVVKHCRLDDDGQQVPDKVEAQEESLQNRSEEPKESSSGGGSDDVFRTPKPRCRKFIFKPFLRLEDGTLSHDDSRPPVDVVIPEQLAASYGLYLWPCAPVLAWYVWLHQDEIRGKRVLELGSGTALPGLLCAKVGASKVWLSDDAWQPNTLKNCLEAANINGLNDSVQVTGLTWGDYTEELFQFDDHQLDFVIGSDLFYDPNVFEPLLTTIAYLLQQNPQAQVLIAVQERSSDWTIEEYLIKWNLSCSYIFPREFLKGTGVQETDLTGRHTIFILKLFHHDDHDGRC